MSGINIEDVVTTRWSEPIKGRFGFKGAYMKQIDQTICLIVGSDGEEALGLGTQNVLWSDADFFKTRRESAANAAMYLVSDKAAQILRAEGSFSGRPDELINEEFIKELHEYAKIVTEKPDLRLTFTLNALVAADYALWGLYKKQNGIKDFNGLIPKEYKAGFSRQAAKVAAIPLMSYTKGENDIAQALKQGYIMLKLKIGHSTDHPAGSKDDMEKMLTLDKERLKMMHDIAKEFSTEYTANGLIPYYLDANGRYGSKKNDADYLHNLIEYSKEIGAHKHILVVEEPFDEGNNIDYRQFDVPIASDESAHSVKDVIEQIQKGARLIALKPIAKTMSETFRMVQAVYDYNKTAKEEKDKVYCFCADLTVIPQLVQLNLNFAARLPTIPGMIIPAFETNGHQHYKNWKQLRKDQPLHNKQWAQQIKGIFGLDPNWYRHDGGIWKSSNTYLKMAKALIE